MKIKFSAMKISTKSMLLFVTLASKGYSFLSSCEQSLFYVVREPIVPANGEKTVERLTALDKSFHTNCFKCEVRITFVDLSKYIISQ